MQAVRDRVAAVLMSLAVAGLAMFLALGIQVDASETVSGPELNVSGRVIYRGKPLTEGFVVLAHKDRQTGIWGLGEIGRDGRFRLRSCFPRYPLIPGDYEICIRPRRQNSIRTIGELQRSRFREADSEVATVNPENQTPMGLDRYGEFRTAGLFASLDLDHHWMEIALPD